MRNMARFLAMVLFVFMSAAAMQATVQEPNCSDPQTTLEMKLCAGRSLENADFDLNSNYQKARSEMRKMDQMLAGGELAGAEIALRDAQRLWIKYRDAACNAEGFTVRGGTMEGLVVVNCLARLTRQRSDNLRRLYELN